MAMIAGASRASRGNTMSGSSTDDNPPARPRPRNARGGGGGGGGGGESEGSEDEVTERGSEVCQIGDDLCTVPSELFNLPSLKGVLSLNTWNYCLTEEERESLALHLPPIEDEEVFKDTIRDLLGGEIFHFTSPVADLFDRLKGGLCHPRVSRYREGLKYLQRKEHYHVLRRYHNHMVSLFVEMQKQWENCPDADIDERLEIWDRFQTEPLPLPKPKRVVRKPGTVRRVKASVEAAPQRRIVSEAPLKMKAIELPKKGKFLLKGRSEVGALGPPSKKKPVVIEPATGSKGVLKIKTFMKDRPEAPSKRIVDIDKVERVEQEEPVRVSKPRPKGVLKLMPKGKNVLKKTASLAVKGKAPATEIKREEPNDVVEYEFEEENYLPFEAEVITSSLDPYIPLRETFEEKKSKHKSSGESKKRKVIDIGGGTRESEVIMKKKKKKQSRELRDQPVEMPEAFANDLSPLEGAKPHVEKGKRSGEPKKKPHRKKKIEEITKEPEVIVVEENRAVEDDFRPSDEVDEKPFDLRVDEDQVDQVKEEVEVKPKKRTKKKPKAEVLMTSPGMSSPHAGSPPEKTPGSATKSSKKPAPIAIATLASTFPFSVLHLLSAVRTALITNYGDGMSEFHDHHDRAPYARERLDFDLPYATSEGSLLSHSDHAPGASGVDRGDSNQVDGEQRPHSFRGVSFSELVRRVRENPGDHRILETVESLQDLVRGALKIMGSKVAPAGTKGWKPLVCFDKEMRTWSWIGPAPIPVASSSSQDVVEVQVTAEAWGIPQKSLLKLEDMFASWLKHGQETLQQIDQLPLPPPPLMPVPVDEKERFRDLRAQKSLMTIAPSSDDMRTYFRRQELVRYSLPDRAFAYTTADGGKSVVAPLRRGGGKPTSKARDHFMLKPDRPPHVTILCLVRDAAARLPGSIGTRADVCALIRDSQFIMEDVSDAQVNQVVSGALDRLHYERDPCVRFDGDRKLWVYLHTEREEEDFEDDGTSSTKRWKKPKKDNADNSEHCAAAYETGSPSGADDPSGTGLMDLHSPDGIDNSAIYSVGRTELVYNKSSSLTSPRVLGNGLSRQDDGDLPFITLPPGIDSGHPMGWEGINTQASWDHDTHLQSQESLGSEDEYYMEGAGTAQRHAEAMFNADTE